MLEIQSILDDNFYLYCNSNPIINVDYSSYFTIARCVVSVPLDMISMAIQPYLATVKTLAKQYAEQALKANLKELLIAYLKK